MKQKLGLFLILLPFLFFACYTINEIGFWAFLLVIISTLVISLCIILGVYLLDSNKKENE